MKYILPVLLLILLLPATALGQSAPPPPQKWFYGGGVGLSFGSVDHVSISPFIGYRITPVVSTGLGLQYVYRNDSRSGQSFSTSDYGADVFTRVYVGEGLFLAASYEYLRFEYFDFTGARVQDDYRSVFVGGGLSQPMGRNGSFTVSAMYNLSYDDNEPSPYDSPWVVGAGVGVGF